MVHNHGPEDGPGIACREHWFNGRLVGDCMMKQGAGEWIGPMVHAELERMRNAHPDQFKRATEIIERVERQAIAQDTTRKVMALIYDTFGYRTRMVEEPATLDAGRR